MNLQSLSINHRTAPVEIREALFLSQNEIKTFINYIKERLAKEGVVISTCNRTEIYFIPADENSDSSKIVELLLKLKTADNVKPEYFEHFHSIKALEHLFSVATGIDSLLTGDNQIFKQVKDSFILAEEMNFLGFLFKRIFDSTLKVGKRAINETAISEGAVTVSFAAVQLVEKIFSNLSRKSALVIGAGETGEIAARHLHERGIGKLAITNRSAEKAESLSSALNGTVIPFAEFRSRLHEFDIIISATSAPEILIGKGEIEKAMKKRNFSSMVLMDIAVPRDIDPSTREIEYVFYHDIDSLNIIVEQNLARRKGEIPKVKTIIKEELDQFSEWYNSLEVAPTIKQLRDWFEAIRAEEVEKNINRFTNEDREKLEIVTKRIINKILHQPTIELRKSSDSTDDSVARINAIRELFGLSPVKDKRDKN